jgi:glutamyl-tRNA reductase
VADANLRERRRQAADGEALVEREVREFLDGQRAFEAVPLVVELRRRGDEIRRAELEKARRRLGPLTPEQERAVDAVTAAIVNKLLHAPTVCLKTLAQEGRSKEEMRLLRAALGLP